MNNVIHSKLDSLASRLVDSNYSREEDQEDDDAIFAELEAEIENDADATVRDRGLEQLRLEMQRAKEMRENAHGRYMEITNEKEAIRISANESYCVIHFYHSNFRRCEIMDKHLAKLAPKYYATRFIRVFVENMPWLVEKLAIKVLPCLMCFVDGVSKDRLIGFEELGNNDAFETAVLELRLANSGSDLAYTSSLMSNRPSTGVLQKARNAYESGITYNVSSSSNTSKLRRGGQTDQDDDEFDL
ncbi:thioredoxin-like protein [Suillus discolor]|uniref:Thioredoxin-like protein n=1 Tax=Suillus discolor TaxID=1912936 RepID=A0A9P7FGD2_9AGAM|nr:thioredoxin-like protein [Suillus discolor]KAG2116074.1 thioredoxin-like protein [Suillus discolor]